MWYRNLVKLIRILFLLFLVSLLCFDITAYLIASTVLDVSLNPETWSSALERQNAYKTLRSALLSDTIKSSFNETKDGLTAEEIESIMEGALPESLMKSEVEGKVSELIRYLRGEKEKFDGRISLTQIKPNIAAAMAKLMEPRIDKMIEEELSKPIPFKGLPCNSPPSCKKMFPIIIEGWVKTHVPDSISLIEPGSEGEKELAGFRHGIQKASQLVLVLLLTSFAVAVIIGFVAFSIKGALRWIGVPLLLLGIVLLLLSLLLPKPIEDYVESKIVEMGGVPTDILMLLKGVAFDFIQTFFSAFMIKSALLAGIGLIMSASSFFIVPATQQHS